MDLFTQHGGFQGVCPTPFLQEDNFPSTGGFVPGRLCFPIDVVNATCCLPCPFTDWTYPDGFNERAEVGNWVNVAAAFATAFLLLSFIILPVKWTHRHYLSMCLTVGVLFIELASIIPLAVKPDQCFNAITPHDMHSDSTCAVSGALLLFGGWAVVIWVFWRAFSIHLQICWEVVPGSAFFYSALALGWGIPAVGLATTLSLTGVSYRFGNICHINHDNGLQDFWGPLLAFAALAMVLQFITVGYCVQVYVKTLLNESEASSGTGMLPSYSGSMTTASARQTYRRVKKVIQLQWRGATIVLFIIAEVTFFSIVFVSMDNSSVVNEELLQKATPWVTCLALSGGNKSRCLPDTAAFVRSEGTVLAVLICLGLSGFWCLLFLGRWSMVLGWRDLVLRKMLKKREFISADALKHPNDFRTYEMLDSTRSTPALDVQTPVQSAMSPSTFATISPLSPDAKLKDEYLDRRISVKALGSPTSIYSRPATQLDFGTAQEWDPRATYATSSPRSMPGVAFSRDPTKS